MVIPLIQVKNLTVDFQLDGITSNALNNINIQIHPGELLAIVGESGSGKSVTALSLLQLLASPPAIYQKGELLFNNDGEIQDIRLLNSAQLCSLRGNRIAMIFQEPMTSLNPVLSCGFQVMEAIILHNKCSATEAKKRTLQLFNKVKLPDAETLFNRYPHQLSGGQKQRVMIAMAMSCEPSLLICDEPTTALDVTVQKSILHLIRELQLQHNMGVLFITHDLSVVAEIADRVAVMYKGKIVEQNTCKQLFSSPVHPYTKALLACRPLLQQPGERLPVVADFMEVDSDGVIQEKSPNTLQERKPGNIVIRENNLLKTPLFTISNLKVYFPLKKTFLGRVLKYTKAVDDISFTIMEGETLGLVGESGCGKSTLGRAILRLVEAKGGIIQYKGIDLLKANNPTIRELRKEMQIIFQDPYSSLNPRISIGDAIAEPLMVHKIIKDPRKRVEKVYELLDKVNLNPSHFHRYPHEFSGGQRQRIVIARALALQPRFIICDESVSALDVSVQAQILNLLNDLKKEFGFTAVFISHDLSVVRHISDRIMVMKKGRIAEIGLADEVYNQPSSEYTRSLIASIPGRS